MRRLSPSRRMDMAYFHHLRANLRQRLGEFAGAVEDAERALTLARETGLPPPQLPHFIARLAHSKLAAGDREGGMRCLEEAIATATGTDREILEQQRVLVDAGFAIDAGDEARAKAGLAQVLADYRARRVVVFLRNRPDLASRFADFALTHDIEPDYVRVLIEKNALRAPDDAGERWPFALRVRVLGGFELARHGEPVRFTGKAQQRPLDLIKALVAFGGSDVDAQQLTAALWPDAEGAAAKTSFDTTLFRLRKLLDVEHAIVLSGGKLSLAPEHCWSDVRALATALDAAHRAADAREAAADVEHAATRLLQTYRGDLLANEDAPWAVKPREALRARFVRAVLALGERLEQRAQWDVAVDLYRRALEADNLSEPLYRGLMRSLAGRGDHAEALSAFRRCRELLSIVLGLKPAADTERLYREIAAGNVSPAPLA
jgi:DNA-binding SARP family transcriptional activator